MSEVRIGTSGWSYPGGAGTWNGIFYPAGPAGRRRGAKFDELAFYAEHFDTVEINSTFYRVPTAETARGWVERTPADFEFSLKLFQKFTHPAMFEKATGADPFDIGQKDVDEFRKALDPLASAGKLGALLAQFPASFKNEPGRPRLPGMAARGVQGLPDRGRAAAPDAGATTRDETLQLLAEYGAALAQIDEPKFRLSIRQSLLPNVRTFYYLRLHGRNAAQWWSHQNSEDRYNYLYTAEELAPFAEAAEAASREVRKAYIYANNHFSAKSVANAAILKHKLGQPLPGEYPEEFVETLSGPEGHREAAAAAAHSRTEAFLRTSAFWIFAATSMPLDHAAEDRVLRVELRRGPQRDVELAVGVLRRRRVWAMPDRAADVPPLLGDLGNADRLAAAVASPPLAQRHVAALGIADLDQEVRLGAMKPQAVVEPLLHQLEDRARRSWAPPPDRSRTRSSPWRSRARSTGPAPGDVLRASRRARQASEDGRPEARRDPDDSGLSVSRGAGRPIARCRRL